MGNDLAGPWLFSELGPKAGFAIRRLLAGLQIRPPFIVLNFLCGLSPILFAVSQGQPQMLN
jgi:hypothetical protein